ncbi:MAG TPA: ABC transporter substrate-binding protein [Acidimicrobiales bacterium]|nr:ABC transporter substrate-binding protein [Acidimicrobiales bacterium]
MSTPIDAFRRMQDRPTLPMILGVGAATLSLLLASIVGAIYVSSQTPDSELAVQKEDDSFGGLDLDAGEVLPDGSVVQADGTIVAPDGTVKTADGTIISGPTGTAPAGPGTSAAPRPGPAAPEGPGNRTGVSPTAIKWGLHAPVTFDGQPVNLAEDPLEGAKIYTDTLNARGGIHGRKIEMRVADDRYTVPGGRQAANDLINDYKAFFVSGTLGVDQVYQVAAEARKQGVPYIAGGGSESVFKDIKMFQVAGSYDTHLELLAEYLGVESRKAPGQSRYAGLKKVGVSMLDSPYIHPAVDVTFRRALKEHGLELVAIVKVQKPTEQTSYASQIQTLVDAGTQIFVPAQDPITTGREVAECRAQRCPWTYSFSNFAHEGNTALQLMAGDWVGVRGLAGGCYYIHPSEGNPGLCGQLKRAHEEWVAHSGQSDWEKDGQGGTAGYQLVHIWTKALQDAGPDPTRERLVAALNSYRGYDNLVSSPISFAGSSNLSHGYDKVVIYEAGPTSYSQVNPGFTDQF